MNQTKTSEAPAKLGATSRTDAWWVEPAMVGIGFALFIAYATWRAVFEPGFYDAQHAAEAAKQVTQSYPYLSPFYSPKVPFDWSILGWKLSPALFVLWIPAGFRATCYYYRKAYYRAYFLDPPACSVGHFGGNKYCGETTFPFVLQNLHRYFFYLAAIVLAFLWYDVVDAFYIFRGEFHVTLINLIMLTNVIFLSGYTFGCHAYRHLVGGKLDCFSCSEGAQTRFKIWNFVTKLNEHHMLWAWLSLFSVGFTDFILRQLYSGALPNELRFF